MYLEERKTERIREGIGIKFRRVNTVIKPPMANLLWLQPMNDNVYGCTLKMHPGEKCNKKKKKSYKQACPHALGRPLFDLCLGIRLGPDNNLPF